MGNDGRSAPRGPDPGRGSEKPGRYGIRGTSRSHCANTMSDQDHAIHPPVTPAAQESYIVSEGKKRGSTRDVRPEAAFDRFYTVRRVHAGDAILTDNWHTNEVLENTRKSFEGYTF